MICPHCQKQIHDDLVVSENARIMQKKGRAKRTYSSDQAREAVRARWAKARPSGSKSNSKSNSKKSKQKSGGDNSFSQVSTK